MNTTPQHRQPAVQVAAAAPSSALHVNEVQVQAAMAHYERLHGRGDGVAICREVAQLADLLGAMWFAHEAQATVPATSKAGLLLLASGVIEPVPT